MNGTALLWVALGGAIGSVASRHLAFMGAQPDHNLTTLRLDTEPRAGSRAQLAPFLRAASATPSSP